MVLSEEEVRKSFARVKEDILQIKRSLNKQLFSVDQLGKSAGSSLQKEEFYAFIKRLGSRIEELENNFVVKSDKEDLEELSSELGAEIASLKKAVERRDELTEEIRQARSLRGKVLELEGIALSKPEFAKEFAKLKAEISGFKAVASSAGGDVSSLSSSLSRLASDISNISARLNSLSATVVQKGDVASFTDRMESSHREVSRGFSALKRDIDRKVSESDNKLSSLDSFEERLSLLGEKLAQAETSLANLNQAVSKKFVDKHEFAGAIEEVRSKLNDTKQVLESSMSEVNLDDYVTKRSFKQQLSSVSESVSSGIMSGVSSRMEGIEGQLKLLKEQLSKELPKFAGSKDVKRLSEGMEKISSGFVSSSEFNSKVDKLESSGASVADDFKKDIKRQREMFEERIKSLESYHRSSNDTIKAKLDELSSSIKSLSKADTQARTEMAKITATAAKAAAKTASEILEEVERELPKRKRSEGGISPLVIAVIIIGFLLVGSFSYILFKGSAEVPVQQPLQLNISKNITGQITPSLPPLVVTPSPAPEKNESFPSANDSAVAPPAQNQSAAAEQEELPIANVSGTSGMADSDQACKSKLECTKRSEGEYWFDCYYDAAAQDCRCYVGTRANCPQVSDNETGSVNMSGENSQEEKSSNAKYYGVVAFILVVVAFLAFRALFGNDKKQDEAPHKKGPKHEKAEKAEKVHEKAKVKEEAPASEAEEPEEEDEVIDLEEFFEKKEPKKK